MKKQCMVLALVICLPLSVNASLRKAANLIENTLNVANSSLATALIYSLGGALLVGGASYIGSMQDRQKVELLKQKLAKELDKKTKVAGAAQVTKPGAGLQAKPFGIRDETEGTMGDLAFEHGVKKFAQCIVATLGTLGTFRALSNTQYKALAPLASMFVLSCFSQNLFVGAFQGLLATAGGMGSMVAYSTIMAPQS